jgi:hypothetical protein
MTRFFQSCPTITFYRLSGAAELYLREEGEFSVICESQTKQFTNLLEAFIFYISVEHEATLWDITNNHLFIERKLQFDLN